MEKRWKCKKCGHLQRKTWSVYHRCSNCGSLDIELIPGENIQQSETQITITH